MSLCQEKIELIQHLMMLIESEAEKLNKNQKSFYEQLKNNHELLIKQYKDPDATDNISLYNKVDRYIKEQKNFTDYIKKIYDIIDYIHAEMVLECIDFERNLKIEK